jgi:hypothetical protein
MFLFVALRCLLCALAVQPFRRCRPSHCALWVSLLTRPPRRLPLRCCLRSSCTIASNVGQCRPLYANPPPPALLAAPYSKMFQMWRNVEEFVPLPATAH